MPEIRLPLVGSFNPRGPVQAGASTITTGKDQLFDNCVFDIVKNDVTQSATVYVERLRADLSTSNSATTASSPSVGGSWQCGTDIISTQFGITDWVFASFSDGGSLSGVMAQIAGASTLVALGEATGQITHIVETIISNVKTFLCTSDDGTGWFFAQDSITTSNTSIDVATTFTANRTSGSVTLAAVSSFAGLYVGQLLSGTGIATGARIASMNTGASTLDMTIAATSGAATSTTVTRSTLAKIIDADFPSSIVGPFACVGGYNAIMTTNGRLYNSNLNSIVSWTSGDYLSTNFYPDNASGGAWVVGNRILCLSTDSGEWVYNAGNPSGSPFLPSTELNFNVGCAVSTLVCRLHDEIYWMSSTSTGEIELYTLRGSTPVQIGTAQLLSLISSGATNTMAGFMTQTLCAFRYAGNRYLSYRGYYVLDIDKGIWSTWSGSISPLRCSGVRGGAPRTREVSVAGELYFIKNLTSLAPYIYKINTDTASSITAPTMTIRTKRIDMGTGNRKSVEYYELDSDIQANGPPLMTLEASDDDFATWTTIGSFDLRQMHPRIYRGGSFKGGRAHRLTLSSGVTSDPFRASTLTIKYQVGKH